MRIIKEAFLKAAAKAHPRAADALEKWTKAVKNGEWRNPAELKQAFSTVDPVFVKSKKPVYVFNIRRNEFRLIAALHFNHQVVYTLRFLTHAEYSRDAWKEEL